MNNRTSRTCVTHNASKPNLLNLYDNYARLTAAAFLPGGATSWVMSLKTSSAWRKPCIEPGKWVDCTLMTCRQTDSSQLVKAPRVTPDSHHLINTLHGTLNIIGWLLTTTIPFLRLRQYEDTWQETDSYQSKAGCPSDCGYFTIEHRSRVWLLGGMSMLL